MEDLKPCPFCESENQVIFKIYKEPIFDSRRPTVRNWHFVLCLNCLCKTSDFMTQSEAAEKWNRRAK